MATTAILCEELPLNARSSDFPVIVGGGSGNAKVATSATDGWVVSPPSGKQFDERTVFIFGSDATGGTVTIKKGDRYPAQRADLGDLVITLAADDGRVVYPETSRFLQDDGTINVVPSTTGLVITAIMLPKAG